MVKQRDAEERAREQNKIDWNTEYRRAFGRGVRQHRQRHQCGARAKSLNRKSHACSPFLDETGPHAVRAGCAYIAADLTPPDVVRVGTFAGKGLADKRLSAEPGLRNFHSPC